ncbi:hypothetical protein L0U88_08490 [Flavihumibacter sp. RY-1]|uniref:Uncharacterized protein n=1 Tax=Flavihumibacter fluminis TaxID=2909236 RepID=A0ABS9BHD5_9BACT|nr:hypothetical protein [Flavihumibacter fluminis]MCF1714660.1 hypothetical protein [Flavihumibacter fluminis]
MALITTYSVLRRANLKLGGIDGELVSDLFGSTSGIVFTFNIMESRATAIADIAESLIALSIFRELGTDLQENNTTEQASTMIFKSLVLNLGLKIRIDVNIRSS